MAPRRKLVDLDVVLETLRQRNPEYARLLEELQRRPLSTTQAASLVPSKSNRAVYKFLRRLEAKGIVEGRINPITNEVIWYLRAGREQGRTKARK